MTEEKSNESTLFGGNLPFSNWHHHNFLETKMFNTLVVSNKLYCPSAILILFQNQIKHTLVCSHKASLKCSLKETGLWEPMSQHQRR